MQRKLICHYLHNKNLQLFIKNIKPKGKIGKMRNDLVHEKREFESIRHIVEYAAETYGNQIAFSFKEKPSAKDVIKVDYVRFRDDVRALASEMISRGMMDKHVVVISKMSYRFVLTYYATLLSGAVLVPLPITLSFIILQNKLLFSSCLQLDCTWR